MAGLNDMHDEFCDSGMSCALFNVLEAPQYSLKVPDSRFNRSRPGGGIFHIEDVQNHADTD